MRMRFRRTPLIRTELKSTVPEAYQWLVEAPLEEVVGCAMGVGGAADDMGVSASLSAVPCSFSSYRGTKKVAI